MSFGVFLIHVSVHVGYSISGLGPEDILNFEAFIFTFEVRIVQSRLGVIAYNSVFCAVRVWKLVECGDLGLSGLRCLGLGRPFLMPTFFIGLQKSRECF